MALVSLSLPTGRFPGTGPSGRRLPIATGRASRARILVTLAFLAVAPLVVSSAGPASAQLLPSGGGDEPINIDADNALEWHQDRLAYVARGDASAVQGDTTVYGDVLTAYYRREEARGNRIHQMVADGHVRIVNPQQVVEGDRAIYDVDRQLIVITGKALKLTTPNEVVTARDSLEYYQKRDLLVARGDALAVRANGERLWADVLLGLMEKGADGKRAMRRIDGSGNVVVVTESDVARAEKLVYSVADEVAVLMGNVRITRDDNQLHGQAAEMNMRTKVNRIIAGADTDGRVKGLLLPERKSEATPAGAGTR